MQQAYKRQSTTLIYILFLEYIVLIATSFLLEILYVGLSLFVHNEKRALELLEEGKEGL